MPALNGGTVPALVWVVNLLLGLIVALIGIIVRMHVASDKEHQERMDKEIALLRQRVHDALNNIAGIQMLVQQRKKDRP